jgi:O-antigen ligase
MERFLSVLPELIFSFFWEQWSGMKVFFWLCLWLLVPGLLLRIPIGGAGILATDIIVAIFACTWLFQKIIIDRSFPTSFFIKSGSFFFFFAIITFFLGAGNLDFTEIILSGAHLLRFGSMLLFGWAATDLFRTQTQQQSFWKHFWKIAGTIVFLGFLQFFLVPDISSWSTEGGLDPHTGRLLGTWLDPNFMAGFLAFILPILIGYGYESKKKKSKIALGLIVCAFLGALFLTFSRSGYLAAGTGLVVFFILRDPKILLVGGIIAIIGIASNERAQKRLESLSSTISSIVFQNTDEIDPTANLRIQSWTKSFELWKKYPITGIGYNTYRYRATEEGIVDENYFSSGGSDSTHLTILVTTGIGGFLIFLWFYGTLVVHTMRAFFRSQKSLFLGFSSGLFALFVHGFFVNSIFFPFLFLPLIALAGVLSNKNT